MYTCITMKTLTVTLNEEITNMLAALVKHYGGITTPTAVGKVGMEQGLACMLYYAGLHMTPSQIELLPLDLRTRAIQKAILLPGTPEQYALLQTDPKTRQDH